MAVIDAYASIKFLHNAYRSGSLSPVQVVASHRSREERLEGKLKAYVTRYSEEAHQQAKEAEQQFASMHDAPPLAGILIALKDLVDIEGRITSGGSPERCNRISADTAIIAQRLMMAGAIISGKTHTVEMATGGWGTNEHLGTPWNPWDLEIPRTPGGSSSGSGVAVAAGYCPGAIGTDTGGSVRLPAAWCGLVGLKVTEGVLPVEGIMPLSSTLDTPGPMARSIDDALIMFEVLRGSDHSEVNTQLKETSGVFAAIREPVDGLVLAILPQDERNGIDPEVLAAYDIAVACLVGLGARTIDKAVPKAWDGYTTDMIQRIISYEGYRFNREILDNKNAVVDPWVKLRLISGRDKYTDDIYQTALTQRLYDHAEFQHAFKNVDAILTPSIPTAAIPLNKVDQLDGPARFTRAANYLGLCSLTVPNGLTQEGLPTGLMITCHNKQEITALRIGKAYEKANKWKDQHPGGLDC